MSRRRSVLVVGTGMAGAACVRALLQAGAQVTVTDRVDSARLAELAAQGATAVVAPKPGPQLLDGVDELVVSPGVPPHDPLVAAAVAAGIEVYSEPELAWRLRGPHAPPWLAVTGTNGKTTTTTMLAAILRAAGLRTAALGNIGEPLVLAEEYDVLAVELSSFQLYYSQQVAPAAGALLNLAEDHLEWHGSFAAYAAAKEAIWRSATAQAGGVAIGNLDDRLVAAALRRVSGTRVGFTLTEPSPGQLGVSRGWLMDQAFGNGRLAPVEIVRPTGWHNVANALAASALALAHDVDPAAIEAGLRGYQPEPHRNAFVAEVAGVRYVDDSKATNPHAAYASLIGYPRVIWVAGGQLKGVNPDKLVRRIARRLAGAVLLGVDRDRVKAALTRHAPDIPVVSVSTADDGAMAEVVAAAAELAVAGDTVLLAPAAASKDMFDSYAHRGDAFASAVRALAAAA